MEIVRANGTTITVIPEQREVISGRHKAFFTCSEWEILDYLYQRKGQVVPREDLVKAIWGPGEVVPTRTVDVHISNIRKKILVLKGARIDSIYGRGYRFVELTRI